MVRFSDKEPTVKETINNPSFDRDSREANNLLDSKLNLILKGDLLALQKHHQNFESYLKDSSAEIFQKYLHLKQNFDEIDDIEKSDILIEVALFLERFLAHFFEIGLDDKKQKYQEINLIYDIKRNFIQKKIIRKPVDISGFNVEDFLQNIPEEHKKNQYHLELYLCQKIKFFLENKEEKILLNFNKIEKYCTLNIKNLNKIHQEGILFNLPKKLTMKIF